MTNVALVTGASAGIGLELAKYHAMKGGDLVLTARREAALLTLKQELESDFGITAHVIAADLGAPGAVEYLHQAIQALDVQISILINNAGFGGHGILIERALQDEHAMIDLNIKSLVELTYRIGGDMARRGGGRILNLGSTAGFTPGPNQAVYFATKAFINSYSQAIDAELRGQGVTCTVLAPGYVATEFARVAKMDHTNIAKSGGATAQSVAKIGYDAMMAGKLIVVNQAALSFLVNWIVPFLPRRLVVRIVARQMSG